MTYRHLTGDERTRIACLLQAGVSPEQIALQLNRSVSTLYRERARNGKCCAYDAAVAHDLARRRASRANAHPRIAARIFIQARRYLTRLDMSPVQIALRLPVSHESLYRWIYRKITQGYAWDQHLRSGRCCRQPRRTRRLAEARRRRAKPLAQRCEAANLRLEFGHWEADLLLGRKDCSAAVLVLKERKSRLTLLVRVGVASSRLKQIHPHGRRTRWRLGSQPQMRKDAHDGSRFFDSRDELQLPTTVRATLDVDIEHALPGY